MINIDTARQLIDFSVRTKGNDQRAEEQLEGSVALYNILQQSNVAYLADEVGMGKTYVAMGTVALFRHFNPDLKVIYIAPKENIQDKWMKEVRNFTGYNLRFPDFRNITLRKAPVKPIVKCSNLTELVSEVGLDVDRDFFLRLSSFSFALSSEESSWRTYRNKIMNVLPWIKPEVFDLRNKSDFKDNCGRAICCALPEFDLMIFDEGHNLKHGRKSSAQRNRMLSLVFGYEDGVPDQRLFPGYGPRLKKILFLSATPVEDKYEHLYNQMDVFGFGKGFEELKDSSMHNDEKKALARKILIRRVTSIHTRDGKLTKNMYRREWRQGGVKSHDDPTKVTNEKERLTVALVQKKVAEILNIDNFSRSFQIGMLASFESFLATAKLQNTEEDTSNFDDKDQTEAEVEREGLDVRDLNRLAKDFRENFNGQELPHPKMDTLVDNLSNVWRTGRKALIFVRRVCSVKEIRRKLNNNYDTWLFEKLRKEMPSETLARLDRVIEKYIDTRKVLDDEELLSSDPKSEYSKDEDENDDDGGLDTFFSWFFRGKKGPAGVVSGVNIKERFIQKGTILSTFFEHNYLIESLGFERGNVKNQLAHQLGLNISQLEEKLSETAKAYLSGRAKKHPKADQFEAFQAASFELLSETKDGLQEKAKIIWDEKYSAVRKKDRSAIKYDSGDFLELETFWTLLNDRPTLKKILWPELNIADQRENFRLIEQKTQMMASSLRLGHSFIDLYLSIMSKIRSLELRSVSPDTEDDSEFKSKNNAFINGFLDVLDKQMNTPLTSRDWGAFDELFQISAQYDLIIDVNCPETRDKELSETARYFGNYLKRQQPVGGMFGQINKTMVQQFRMPGYPFVMISTDLLQEGEDLHTFCSEVFHYGIAWSPSSMEQRIGRVDRVRSLTERRLNDIIGLPAGDMKLQVYYPYLEDTVEILQVQNILGRMDDFMEMMHEDLIIKGTEQKKIKIDDMVDNPILVIRPVEKLLKSAFRIRELRDDLLQGDQKCLAITSDNVTAIRDRFECVKIEKCGEYKIEWESHNPEGSQLGTVRLNDRQQPFSILLGMHGQHFMVKCISPIGEISLAEDEEDLILKIGKIAFKRKITIGVIPGAEERSYNLTVEGSVILGEEKEEDKMMVSWLINKIISNADLLEKELLKKDEPMRIFKSDLLKEGYNGE